MTIVIPTRKYLKSLQHLRLNVTRDMVKLEQALINSTINLKIFQTKGVS